MVDRIAWFRAPAVMGGDGLPAVQAFGVERLAQMPRFVRQSAVTGSARDMLTKSARASGRDRSMFTGIVTGLGRGARARPIGGGHDTRLEIGAPAIPTAPSRSAPRSPARACCLTAVEQGPTGSP